MTAVLSVAGVAAGGKLPGIGISGKDKEKHNGKSKL